MLTVCIFRRLLRFLSSAVDEMGLAAGQTTGKRILLGECDRTTLLGIRTPHALLYESGWRHASYTKEAPVHTSAIVQVHVWTRWWWRLTRSPEVRPRLASNPSIFNFWTFEVPFPPSTTAVPLARGVAAGDEVGEPR